MQTLVQHHKPLVATAKDYIELCKPRVVMLMIVTSIVGMCLAPASSFSVTALIFGNLGIALVAGAAAVLNHIADQHLDKIMSRTQNRPLAQERISTKNSIIFASLVGTAGMIILLSLINGLTAALTFFAFMGYAVFYTFYLKQATPQNIVIGGISGAMPPLLGWTAVTGSISPEPLLLVLIIFIWTPPHFWALAIHRLEDYAKVNIPMLPHTHGVAYTKLCILLYTLLLLCVTTLPVIVHMSGFIYLIGSAVINLGFLFQALRLYWSDNSQYAMITFRYSIYYLGILFLLLLFDHYYSYFFVTTHAVIPAMEWPGSS